MKRLSQFALATLGLLTALSPSTQAQLLFSDDFESYTVDTSLNTSGPWGTASLGGNPVLVRDENTDTPFGTPNQYLDHNDNTSGSIRIQSPNLTAASGVVTTFAFDFEEPSTGGGSQFIFGYTMTNGDLTSSGRRIMPRLDDGSFVSLSTTANGTYSLDTPYRLYVVFNDSGSTINYLSGSLASGVADLWIQPEGGGALTFVGTVNALNDQTSSYRIGFRGYGSNLQHMLLDDVTLHEGIAVPGATPTLLSTTPTDDDGSVTASTNLVANFDMPISAGTGNITITGGVSPIVLDVATAPEVSIAGSTLTIDLTSDLDIGTAYSVQIDSTAIVNVLGEAYAGISTTTEWNFMTSSDSTPPVLQTRSPADDASGVAVDSNLVVTFDEDIAAGSGNIVITNVTEATTFATINITDGSQVTISGTTLTINPTGDLAEGRTYAVEIDSGAVTDTSTNAYGGISGTSDWNFDTVADTTDPLLVGRTPGDNSTRASIFNNLVATFDEAIQPGTGNVVIKNLTDATTFATYAIGDTEITIAGNQLTIDYPGALETDKDYAVQIDAGAVIDLSSNSYAGITDDTTWNFTTTRLLSRDYIIGERQSEAAASEYYPDAASNVVGTGGASNKIDHRNVVLGLTLPTLPPGQTAGSVDFEFEITAARDTTGAGNLPELHVYLLDTANPDGTGDSFFFEGPSDPSASAKLVTTTSVTISGSDENNFADDSEDRIVTLTGDALALIQSFYGGDHIPEQPEVFFRFNLGEDTLITTYRRYRIDVSSGEADIQVTGVSTAPPTLASTVPADDGTTTISENLVATFDKPIAVGSGNIVIRDLTNNSIFATIAVTDATQASISGSDLIIDPTLPLVAGAEFAVQIDNGAVLDGLGQPYAGIVDPDVTTWSFTTPSELTASAVDSIRGRATTASLDYFPNSAAGGRVGVGGPSTDRQDYNIVVGFILPTLPVGETVSGGTFEFEIRRSDDNGKDLDLDVYLLDTADPDSSGISFFYQGDSDPNTDVAFVGAVNAVAPGDVTYDPDELDETLTITGDALALLQSFYGGDHIPEQTEVFFRFNLDELVSIGVYDRYFIETATDQSLLTLASAPVSPFSAWAALEGLTGPDALPGANPDSDNFTNLEEFAYGTDPEVSDSGFLTVSPIGRGAPTTGISFGPLDFEALFMRRLSHVADGLTYTVQFSADLQTWVDSTEVPTQVAVDGDYEIVEVPYEIFLPGGQKARFFRVQVELN